MFSENQDDNFFTRENSLLVHSPAMTNINVLRSTFPVTCTKLASCVLVLMQATAIYESVISRDAESCALTRQPALDS